MADGVLRPAMQDRVEIDTSLPFQSVKAAVSMFGEKVNGKKSQTIEKPSLKNSEVHQLKEELAAVKHQLAEAEEAKVKAYEELRGTRKLLEGTTLGCVDPCTSKQVQACNVLSASRIQEDNLQMGGSNPDAPLPEQSNKNNPFLDGSADEDMPNMDASKQSNSKAEEKHVVWEVELKVAQEQHMTAVAELESVKKDLERLKEELVGSLREKENALRQAEEALMTAELNAKRVEELSHEMSGTNESLNLVKLACIEASKERAALLAAKGGTSPHLSNMSEHSMLIVEELELKLAVTTKELVRLQEELALAKEAEVTVASAASEAYANLALAKSELEKTRMQAYSANGSSSIQSPDLMMTKDEFDRALENGESLQATLGALQRELETMRNELVDLRDREAVASAAVVTLTAELARTKEDLTSAIAAETKANEAITILNQTLQQIRVEADEARATADILQAEATKVRVDAEYAKSALANSEQEAAEAIEAAEAAKAAEMDAFERFKAMSEKMSEVRVSGAEGGAGISVTQDEYEELKRKVHEAEDLANMKIAAANARVEAVKISEMELQQKMKALNDDIDTMKSNTEQALRRAEMAEAAKLVVESEMRRWRGNRKGRERELEATIERDYERERERQRVNVVQGGGSKDVAVAVVGSKSQPSSYSSAQPAESLAQILNMKMPSLASDRSLGQKKKKHYILPTLTIFSTKKNQSLDGGGLVEI